MNKNWDNFLEEERKKEYFSKIESFLKEERINNNVYPVKDDVFNAFNITPLSKVKVVILGQDPYYKEGQAHGLAFSVKKGVKIPPSLRNMYKELESDIEHFKSPEHGDLTSWSEQGVFLLNNVLTVTENKPDSHKKIGWEIFTDSVIDYINENCENVVFILWGGNARKKAKKLNKEKHMILESAHPSPLSSYRGFFGCAHFSKTNDFLEKNNLSKIKWEKL